MSKFVSVQDVVADPEAPTYRYPPLRLLLNDLYLVTSRTVPHFFNIFLPLNLRRGFSSDVTYLGIVFQLVLTVWSVLLYVPLLLLGILVGGITPLLVGYATAWPFLAVQGDPLVKISPRESTVRDSYRRRHAGEAWLFINGICTSRSGVNLIIRRLETLFQRPVTGILNRTLGPIVDLLECILQRDVDYATESVREGFKEVKRRLQDDKLDKVVLLCHSQGGIIASLIVDQLLDDLPVDQIQKLEIYTFANAANHFSNPIIKNRSLTTNIRYVEHYANGKDPVSQIGVLAYSMPVKNARRVADKSPQDEDVPVVNAPFRFNGRLFYRAKVSGHLLLSHYLGPSSILNTVEARRHSRLRQYIGGNSPQD